MPSNARTNKRRLRRFEFCRPFCRSVDPGNELMRTSWRRSRTCPSTSPCPGPAGTPITPIDPLSAPEESPPDLVLVHYYSMSTKFRHNKATKAKMAFSLRICALCQTPGNTIHDIKVYTAVCCNTLQHWRFPWDLAQIPRQ